MSIASAPMLDAGKLYVPCSCVSGRFQILDNIGQELKQRSLKDIKLVLIVVAAAQNSTSAQTFVEFRIRSLANK